MTNIFVYDKELKEIQNQITPMHEATTTYYNPYSEHIRDFESQLNQVQDMIDAFYYCTGIAEEFETIEDCNYCYDYNGENNMKKRIEILTKEFNELKRLDKKTTSIRYL